MLYEQITIGGEKRPVKFGFNGLAMFCDMTGITVSQLQNLGSTMTPRQIIQLAWCGLADGARAAGRPFEGLVKDSSGDSRVVPVTVEMVGDWLDEDPNILAEMMNIYGNAQAKPSKKKK